MPQINQGAACHQSNYSSRDGAAIRYIVIHYTANNGDTAQNNCTYSSGANRGASAHYFVGEDGIYRSVPDEYRAWHCGGTSVYKHAHCRNANSIGIEMCSRLDSAGRYYIKDNVIRQTIELTKYLMDKYSIPVENVIRHYDVWNKQCPEPFVRNPQLWTDFKQRLTEEGLTVTQYEELKKEIQNLKPMIYNYMDNNMPSWAKPTIQKLMDKGILVGDEEGKLGLTMDMIKVFVINDRAGLYD